MGRASEEASWIALGGLLTTRLAFGQTGRRIYRVGSVYLAASATTKPYEEAFLAGLQELGFDQ